MGASGVTMDGVAIEGCTVNVRVEGEDGRPALVLSHMLGTDLTLWDDLVPALTKHFRVVRYDTRGHGGSGLGETPVTIARLGRDVVAILDALEIGRAHFLGLSMGGAVGLWLLAHAPARIERAVIAGSTAKLGEPRLWNARIAAALADGMEQAVEPTIARWFSPVFAARAPEPVERVRALLRATSPEGYAACCAALRDMDLREAVRVVANPVLVLRGADDPSVPAADVERLVEAMANATAAEVDTRHCSVIEDGPAFAAAVVKFLTARTAPRRTASKAPKAQAKPSARRAGNRGLVAARRPVARNAPVSGKAVAKASASRKTAARAATPAPSRRRAAAEATRVPAPNAVARKASASKTVAAKPRSVKGAPAAKSARAPGRRATTAISTLVRARPVTAAALRAATKAKAAPGKKMSGKAAPSTSSARATKTGTRTAKPAVGKAAATKAKASGAKSAPIAKTAPTKTAPTKTAASKTAASKTAASKTAASKTKPAASRRVAMPAAKPRRSPGRGPAGSGRRKP